MAGSLIIILLITGLAIGFLSGLLGIGGGIIMTPVQYWLYTAHGMSSDIAIKLAFATSLAVILPTAASGVWQHQKRGCINWKAAVFMGIFTAAGSFIGATLTSHISGSVLKIGFGILALLVAVRMVTVKIQDIDRPIRQNHWLWFGLAFPLGIITGILGLGGGILVIPVLVLVLRFRMRNAVGTSLAMLLFTSLGGIIGYIVNGLNVSGLPAHTIGYIYWPAWLALAATSIILAQLGAIAAHKIHGRYLNYILVVLLFYISLDMLGVIGWVGGKFSG
jgi:uncharacterized membrane protein YfcA